MSRRVVVVTGASVGLGRAIARAFAAQGANLALIARGREGLEAAARKVEVQGGRARVLPRDVVDAAAVEAAAARTERELGPIDVRVNNAMVPVFSPIPKMRPEEIRRVTGITYLGAVHGALAATFQRLARNTPRFDGSFSRMPRRARRRGTAALTGASTTRRSTSARISG